MGENVVLGLSDAQPVSFARHEKWAHLHSITSFCSTTTLFTADDITTVLQIDSHCYRLLRRTGLLKASGALPGRSRNALQLHNFFDILECHFLRHKLSREVLKVCHGVAVIMDRFEPDDLPLDAVALGSYFEGSVGKEIIETFLAVFDFVIERILSLLIYEGDH
jgi:hypothetical protein